MEWVIALIIFVVIFGIFSSGTNKEHKYRKRGALFTTAERSFLGVLDQAVSEKFRIFGKVRVADIITPAKGLDRKNWQSAFNRISSKHFDYVLCSKESLEVIAVIELDDKSHTSKKAIKRDKLIESACKSADIKLIRFKAKRNYRVHDVSGSIETALNPSVGLDINTNNETK